MLIDKLEEVLLLLSYKDEDQKSANDAFTELYREYSKFLYALVRKKLNQMGVFDEQIMETAVGNTFLKIYENPLVFKVPENENTDNCFKAWLSVVSKNELLVLFKQYYGTNITLESSILETVFEDTIIKEPVAESINVKLMQDAMNTLSERDREVLSALYLYQEEGKNTPSTVLDTLCLMYGTTKDNIRQIKKRSESKIIDYFSKNSNLKPIKDVK